MNKLTPTDISQIIEKVNELKTLLDYFSKIEKPLFSKKDCPFGGEDHYQLSQATGGLGCYMWNCPLCGEEMSE